MKYPPDFYPDIVVCLRRQYHYPGRDLMAVIKQKSRRLPFLGGLKITFEIAPPKPEGFRNQLKRQLLEI